MPPDYLVDRIETGAHVMRFNGMRNTCRPVQRVNQRFLTYKNQTKNLYKVIQVPCFTRYIFLVLSSDTSLEELQRMRMMSASFDCTTYH